MSFSSDFNIPQQKVIDHRGSHFLVVAGPGTGKTHTLTHRIAEKIPLLTEDQKILAITFTHKAADEMKDRLFDRLSCPPNKVFAGTFHGFCRDVLKAYASHVGLPDDFNVVSPEEIQEMVVDLWPAQSTKERKILLEKISFGKATGQGAPTEGQVYDAFLRARSFLDFDDLLSETVRLLEKNEPVREALQRKYPFVFVDEYQDINFIQNKLLRLLVGPGVMVTAIGDPNQAIYGFRGSDVIFFSQFTRDFPGAAIVTLTENYRSGQNIVQASTQVMAESDFEVPPLTARLYAQGRLTVYEAPTDKAEAEYVVHAIERMVGGTTMFSQDSGRVDSHEEANGSFGDIAVLYRLNHQRRVLEEAFARSGIPYQVSGEEGHLTEYARHLGAEKVSLLTIHAAKGLEFPVVFMIGCEETLLPLDLENLTGHVEEERRLFYVGMTRAKEMLTFIHAKRRRIFGRTVSNAPSRFLTRIEEKLKEYAQATSHHPRRKNKETSQIELF